MNFQDVVTSLLDLDFNSAFIIGVVVALSAALLILILESLLAGLFFAPILTGGALAGNATMRLMRISLIDSSSSYDKYANVALSGGVGIVIVFLMLMGLALVYQAAKSALRARAIPK